MTKLFLNTRRCCQRQVIGNSTARHAWQLQHVGGSTSVQPLCTTGGQQPARLLVAVGSLVKYYISIMLLLPGCVADAATYPCN